jgi:hypothetical protein
MKMLNRLYNLLLAAVLLTTLGAAARAQSFPRELHEVYNLNPDGTVSVTNTSGNIRISTWNESRVQVDAVKNARREEDWPLVEIRVVSRPERLEITTIYPRGRSNSTSVEYDLKVPRSATLDTVASTSGEVTVTGPIARAVARSTSGNVTATDVTGAANLSSTSGNARAERIGGSLSITATSGNVIVNEVAGRLNARSASGNIRASKVRDDATAICASGWVRLDNIGGRVTARSSSGPVSVLTASGDVEATSNSDNVTVEDVRGRVIASSLSGNVIVRKADEGVRANSTSANVEIVSAKGRIEAETISGSILLRDVDSRDLRLKSLSSSVRYQGRLYDDGRYEFNSFSGDVVITIPAESEFNLTAQTFSGTINTDFPIQLTAGKLSSRGPVQGVAGKGGAQVKAESFSGSVYIKKQVAQAR